MTVKLELPPDIEAGLLAQAQTHGLPLEAYLVEHLLRGAVEKRSPGSREEKAWRSYSLNPPSKAWI